MSSCFIGSPARSIASEDEDDLFSTNERDYGDDFLMEWAMVSGKRFPFILHWLN